MATPNAIVELIDRVLETPAKLAFGFVVTLRDLVLRPSHVFAQRHDLLRTNLILPPATFFAACYAIFLLLMYSIFVIAFRQSPLPVLQVYFMRMSDTLAKLDFANALLLSIPFVAFLAVSTIVQKAVVRMGRGDIALIDLLHANFYVLGLTLIVVSGFWGSAACYMLARRWLGISVDTTQDPISLLLASIAGLGLIAAFGCIAAAFNFMVVRNAKMHDLAAFALVMINALTPALALLGVTWLFSRGG